MERVAFFGREVPSTRETGSMDTVKDTGCTTGPTVTVTKEASSTTERKKERAFLHTPTETSSKDITKTTKEKVGEEWNGRPLNFCSKGCFLTTNRWTPKRPFTLISRGLSTNNVVPVQSPGNPSILDNSFTSAKWPIIAASVFIPVPEIPSKPFEDGAMGLTAIASIGVVALDPENRQPRNPDRPSNL